MGFKLLLSNHDEMSGTGAHNQDHSLHWRHNERGGVSDHQPHDCLLNRLFRGRSKKPSKLRVTGLCVGNSPETGEFPAHMASNAEYVSIWWRHHENMGNTCVFNKVIFNAHPIKFHQERFSYLQHLNVESCIHFTTTYVMYYYVAIVQSQ